MRKLLAIFLLITNTSLAQINLNQGLIAHYPFSGNANDISGNNINGTVVNVTITSDRNGNANSAYYFNGTNSYIQLPFSNLYNFAAQDSFSISVWVLPDPGNTWPAEALVVKAPTHPDFTLSAWNYGVYLYDYKAMSGYAYNHILNGTTLLTPNTCWYNIVSTYKNGVWKLYVNGILESSDFSQTKFILQDGNSRIFFGKKGESFGDWYKGKMDEVRIYNRVLNQDEVNTIVGTCQTQTPCNNWLKTATPPDAVTIGDLDISGNKLTIEANFNRIAPYSGGYLYGGDIVSKHADPTDCNYLLRPNNAEITTSNGFFQTAPVCEISLNKTYHVAMTYDGSTLKFYRNGFLMSQKPASGNLVLNNWLTTIGDFAPGVPGITENMNGFINEVRIWNVARTQAEIQTYMNNSLPNPATQTGLLAYYTFDNLLNKQGNATWNGTIRGSATINATNTSCAFTADSCLVTACTAKKDFSFTRNPCSPYTISFSTTSTSYSSIFWDFGDTNTATGSSTVSHAYITPGNYQVVMIQDYGTCIDTVKKTITVNIQNDNQTVLTNDTTICLGKTKQLVSSPALSYCWSPTTFLNNPSAQNPISSATKSITYYLTTESNGSNLIVNGDFSSGNNGFTSQYVFANSNVTEGQYFVGNNPQAWNMTLSRCTDHTGGAGNMMLVNGSSVADVKIWSQTVNVTPNTNYSFSTWIQTLWSPNPAQLQFSINGNDIGNLITASLPTCSWTQFYTTWNSGNNSSAVISIINKNTQVQGNDFALDDIALSPVYIKRDSIKITVDTPSINTSSDFTVCEGIQTQLATTGASTYTWSPSTGLSNSTIANPIATPATTTKYIVAGINNFGCVAKDSVTITVNPKPTVTITNDTLLCNNTSLQLSAGGGTSYLWSPAASLSNNLIPNPVALPLSNTKYYVTVKDANNCSNTDSVQVDVRSENNFFVSPPVDICINDSIQLTASGGDTYSWNNASTLDNASLSNPIALPQTTTTYSVLITDTVCHNSTTLTTTVTVLPLPVLLLTKSNDIDCSANQSQLTASGATQYSWLPAGTLNNSNIYNPIAFPAATTNYIVTGTDLDGCMNTDSITVLVNADNKGGYLMPNAFTPNNDGLNDCFGTRYWGVILEIEFSIYNRWGERVFYTTDPAKCWDGTYKGILQDPAVFSYIIKAKTSCESYVFRKGTFTLIR